MFILQFSRDVPCPPRATRCLVLHSNPLVFMTYAFLTFSIDFT